MKEWISKYQKIIVGTGAIAVLVLCYFQQKELSKLRIQQVDFKSINTIDSLKSELFVQQTIVTRYEVALELLKKNDKKAADKFELILTTQTE